MQVEQLREALREVRLCNEAAETRRTELAQRVSDAAHAVWGRLPMLEMQLESASRDHQRLQTELSSHNSELKGRLAELETRSSVSDSLRMELAERASQALHSLSDRLSAMEKVPHRRAETGGTLAELYAEFEDIFRGPTEQIKQRLQVYIPLLREAQLGSPDAAVLDLGCGRGEWIQLLTGHGFSARGIDRNPVMVRRCVDIGLQVSEVDALTHLRSLPPASLGAITSFHMIEHLAFETVLAIVDEALRALRPGGLLILETPNPHNLMVGAETFWIDPTHLHPIPSQTLRFFVEARGFRQVEIWDLQPYPEAERLPHAPGLAEWVNQRFYGPRDYSVIGRRP
jgi:SAM-dependent methyltransferase